MEYLILADYILHFAHILLISVNVFGWMFKRTRRINLLLLNITLLSWFGLGFWYGFGYCPLTDWQWSVKESLGQDNLPYSYIKYLFDNIFSVDSNERYIDYLTFAVFFISLGISSILNYRDFKTKN